MRSTSITLALSLALLVGCGGWEFERQPPSLTGGASGAHSGPDGKTIIVNGGGGSDPSQPNTQPPQTPPPPPPQDPNNPPQQPSEPLPEITPGQGSGSGSGNTPQQPPQGSCGTAWESQVFDLTNQERANNGLPPFQCTANLTKAAHDYSQTMCDTGHFSHTGPDGSSPGDRMRRAGVTNMSGWGENIAWGQSSPASVVQTWMNSPGHRANILGNFSHMGPGHVQCGNGRNYWVQTFATIR
ncbi:MAG: hypothetical protein KC503_14045 [Myxococcales bacterium]|nr:hypothetical protein [Myxococcales bacterium]